MPELLEPDELDVELAALPRATPSFSTEEIDTELAALPRSTPAFSSEEIDAELAALPRTPRFYSTESEAKAAGHEKPVRRSGPFKSPWRRDDVWFASKEAADEDFNRTLERAEQIVREAEGPMLKLRYQQPKGVLQGLANVPLGLGEFFTSPAGISAAVAGPLGGPAAIKGTAAYFLGDIAAHAPEQIHQLGEAVRSGQPGPIAESAGGIVATPFFMRGLYKGATRPLRRPIERAEPAPIEVAAEVRPVPLELKAEPSALKAAPEGVPIELLDLTDKKVYGPGGEAGHVTWSGIGIVEVDTGKGVKTWRKEELDQAQLFGDYPEVNEPGRKLEPFVEERPPDIIDAIEETYGAAQVINAREVHALDPNFPKNGFELNRMGWPRWFKKLFYYPKEGESKKGHPQDVLNALQREGLFLNVEDTADAFMGELFRAMEQRRSGAKVESREAKVLAEQEREAIERERAEKIVEVAFENEERAAMAEAERLGAKAKIVDKFDENEPFAWVGEHDRLAGVDKAGNIVISRSVLNRALEQTRPEERADAIRALVHEEAVHRKVTDAEAKLYWESLTVAEQAFAKRIYGGRAKGRPELTDANWGHESLVLKLQQLSGMTPRQVLMARGFERLTLRTIAAIDRVVFNLRRALGTDASSIQIEMLDRLQRNLDAARVVAVREAEGPAAFLRREGELPLEEGKGREGPVLPRAAPRPLPLSAQARREAYVRKELSPADIAWRVADDPRHPAGAPFRVIIDEETRNVGRLGNILTEGARIQEATPSVTRRVTAVLNNARGIVELLSTFKEHGTAMILDPNRAGLRKPHVPLADLLSRRDAQGHPVYRVLDSHLVDPPVKDFRQRFDSVAAYRTGFRDDVAAEAASRERGIAERTGAVGFEEGRPQAIAVEEPQILEPERFIGEADAASLYDHLYQTVGKLENVDDILLVAEELRDRPNRAVSSAYLKWLESIQRDNPGLSREQLLDRLNADVYETVKAAANKAAFVARSQERNRPVVPEPPSGVAAPAEGGIEGPAAFWRDAGAGGKHLAERIVAEPLRLFSEWMVDRLERAGGPLTKRFAQTARRIIDRQKQLEGELRVVLNPAIKEAGKPGRASTWFDQFADKPTPYTAIRNAAPALESMAQEATTVGRPQAQFAFNIPAYARTLARLADVANRAIGNVLVGVSRLEEAWGGFQRNITGIGYDTIRRGFGPMWERWTEGVAVANAKSVESVREFFGKWKAILDDPTRKAADVETVNQDFRREYPKAITDVRDPLGQWQPVVHSHLFDYLQNAARRATHVRAFREVFPATDAGRKAFDRALNGERDAQGRVTGRGGIRNDTPGQMHADLDALIRTLNGHPTDNYSNASMALSASALGTAFRTLNNTLGNLSAKAALTTQVPVQLAETIYGAAHRRLGLWRGLRATGTSFLGMLPNPGGAKRYLKALADAEQTFVEMERSGKRDAIFNDWSLDPHSPIRSAFRIAGNVFEKGFMTRFLNEVQEGTDAIAAKIVADDIATGNLSKWDRRQLPETFRAMQFSERQVSDMMAGRRPDLLEVFQRRASPFLSGGHKAIAEHSRLGANRLFRSVFRFQDYPMTRMNEARQVYGRLAEAYRSGDSQQKFAATEQFVKFHFALAWQGAMTAALVTFFTEGLAGLMVKKEEWEDRKFRFMLESLVASMAGPLYALFRGARDKGVRGMGEQAGRMFFPYSQYADLMDMTGGQGQYRDMDGWSRMGRYVQQKTPGLKPIRVAFSAIGLAEPDLKTEAAIRAFGRWQREQPGFEERGTLINEDERGRFRTTMKNAVTALKSGDRKGFEAALDEAVGEAAKLPSKQSAQERVAESLRGKRILHTPARKYYFKANGDPVDPELLKRLESRIGSDAVNRLRYYDAMLEQMAKALNPAVG